MHLLGGFAWENDWPQPAHPTTAANAAGRRDPGKPQGHDEDTPPAKRAPRGARAPTLCTRGSNTPRQRLYSTSYSRRPSPPGGPQHPGTTPPPGAEQHAATQRTAGNAEPRAPWLPEHSWPAPAKLAESDHLERQARWAIEATTNRPRPEHHSAFQENIQKPHDPGPAACARARKAAKCRRAHTHITTGAQNRQGARAPEGKYAASRPSTQRTRPTRGLLPERGHTGAKTPWLPASTWA